MSRELPIHNGRMTTDLDANGFKIKNLPPGSGFTQAQADWNQADATAPDFIKNKPTIPAAVTIDATLTQQGAAADAKAVGDALRGGFTEWEFSGQDAQSGHEYAVVFENGSTYLYDGDSELSEIGDPLAGETSIDFNSGMPPVQVTATRHLITPTKTSQLQNDGDGTSAFVKTNDTRLSDARTPTAHTHAMADVTGLNAALAQKANATDLPYRLVEPGKWEFSDGEAHGISGPNEYNGTWYYTSGVYVSNVFNSESEAVTALTLTFTDPSEQSDTFTATRPSLPGHLCDRAGNRVVVTGDTTLTLPDANPGYLRDFLVRLEISGSTVPSITFAAPTGETIVYETDGDEFPVPDEAGTWSYSFTENCVAHTFAVSLKKVNVVAQGGS